MQTLINPVVESQTKLGEGLIHLIQCHNDGYAMCGVRLEGEEMPPSTPVSCADCDKLDVQEYVSHKDCICMCCMNFE